MIFRTQVKKDINFVFAEEVEDVLKVALKGWKPEAKVRRTLLQFRNSLAAN